ncbi:MAG TPA: class I SAM-dependent methyltransferase [Vicinamibacterales bacterium]|nr:class I SAM-dependent methyltransferase [Vicinamibacterales bacterium]
MFKFRRMRTMDPLQVAMTGVRMGEKYLQVFCHDASLTRGLAMKTGLSGAAALAAPDEAQAKRGKKAAEQAGALIDIKVLPVSNLDWPEASFDMVVVDETGGNFSALAVEERAAMLQSALRVMRPGGRIELIERISGGLLGGVPAVPAEYAQAGGAEGSLREGGFRPVRTLAEKDGFRFVEGLKA